MRDASVTLEIRGQMLKMFQALPPYFGGKRRLVGEIFRRFPAPSEAPILVDAFLGGGAVSLYAKARGYQVIANDVALRSHVVGKALIENDGVRLSRDDVLGLFAPNDRTMDFVERRFSPDVFTRKHARFLDLALANASAAEGERRSLLQLLLVKYMFKVRPMGNFGAKTIVRQLEANDWDGMNPNYVREDLNRRIHGHPLRLAEGIAREINVGVFSNGRENRAVRADVFDFLGKVEGHVGYFDPPYAGTTPYESALRVIDSVLEGGDVETERSVFSRKDGLAFVDRMLEAAKRIPHWVLSLGNAEDSLADVVEVVRRHRPVVDAREIAYAHLRSLTNEERACSNREFLVVARKP